MNKSPRYRSTRGSTLNMSFEDTLFTGWIDKKELTMPEELPTLHVETFKAWSKLSYKELSQEIFHLFAGEDLVPRNEYNHILEETYKNWSADIIPIKKLEENTFIAELFNGPSHSFKDISLSVIGEVLNAALKKSNKFCVNYACTTGDTGAAIIETTKNKSNIESLIFLPKGKMITEFQRLLMTTQDYENIHNFDADSSCDPLDFFLMELSQELKMLYPNLVITSLNSIVWIRIMLQTVHIFYSYFHAVDYPAELSIGLPTGGLGHGISCIIAKKLGLPIKIITCFNSKNQNLYNFLNGGSLFLNASSQTSLSPAIDIQNPTNIERVIYLLANGDSKVVKEHMEEYYNNGSMKLSPQVFEEVTKFMETFLTSDEEILTTIQRCYKDFQYIIDPHTAVAFHHYYKSKPTTPIIFMACASPIKFQEVYKKANVPLPLSYQEYYKQLKAKKEVVFHLSDDKTKWKEETLNYIRNILLKKNLLR